MLALAECDDYEALAASTADASLDDLEAAIAPEMPGKVRRAAIDRLAFIGGPEAFTVLARIALMDTHFHHQDAVECEKAARRALAFIGPPIVGQGGDHAVVVQNLFRCLELSYADEATMTKVVEAVADCHRLKPEKAMAVIETEMDRVYAEAGDVKNGNPALTVQVHLGRLPNVAAAIGPEAGVRLLLEIGRRLITTYGRTRIADQCGGLLDDVVETLGSLGRKSALDALLHLCDLAAESHTYRPRVWQQAIPVLVAKGKERQQRAAWKLIAGMLDVGRPDAVRRDAMRTARHFGDIGFVCLTDRLRNDGSPEVRKEAAAALREWACVENGIETEDDED
ncbi:hypothetical protein AMJ57_03350 [Parcubacteria bacterium SG8_24]|nr:MAG: hypothetical protein AMJ57_03350 [Parcubacteria bacterium SG8_24]